MICDFRVRGVHGREQKQLQLYSFEKEGRNSHLELNVTLSTTKQLLVGFYLQIVIHCDVCLDLIEEGRHNQLILTKMATNLSTLQMFDVV